MRKNFGAKPMCYPMPVYIIGTYGADGTPNAMNAAWGGISEETEISICVSEDHKTTKNIAVKLIATAILAVGVLLMVEKKKSEGKQAEKGWIIYAILSAVFAALTSILAKVGISGVESNLGTAIRTAVVLLLAWGIVFARKKHKGLATLDRRELLFIVLSGIATGASWLAYYYALGNGEASVVVPIDKMSILVTVAFSYTVFKEKLSKKAALGLALMTVGTLMMALFT